MATPTGITLNNFDVIIEISSGDGINTAQSLRTFGGGYVRQIGTLVTAASVDDYVQYNPTAEVQFSQVAGTTFTLVHQDKIYFVQAAIP
jgi:hypothetical protein